MHALITQLWSEYSLTIIMVTHDIREAFSLGTRVLALDKLRQDPHAPHRYGASVAYDIPIEKKNVLPEDMGIDVVSNSSVEIVGSITVDTTNNN